MKNLLKCLVSFALLGFLQAGCSVRSAMKSQSYSSIDMMRGRSMPTDLENARREMRLLERVIDRELGRRRNRGTRGQAGRARGFAPPPPTRKAPAHKSLDDNIPTQPTATPRPAPQRNETVQKRATQYRRRRLTPCQRLCRSSQGICFAAGRICRIAARFSSELSFQAACGKARQDCNNARRRCRRCR